MYTYITRFLACFWQWNCKHTKNKDFRKQFLETFVHSAVFVTLCSLLYYNLNHPYFNVKSVCVSVECDCESLSEYEYERVKVGVWQCDYGCMNVYFVFLYVHTSEWVNKWRNGWLNEWIYDWMSVNRWMWKNEYMNEVVKEWVRACMRL